MRANFHLLLLLCYANREVFQAKIYLANKVKWKLINLNVCKYSMASTFVTSQTAPGLININKMNKCKMRIVNEVHKLEHWPVN